MSQLPPDPYGNPPPPPYGQPPVYGQGYPPPAFAPAQTSGAAVASLVLGILGFCIPAVSGLVAVILGIVGIRSTAKPNVKGRGLAIAGLVLGVLTLLGWLSVGGMVAAFYAAAAPDRAAARQFLTDLSAGNAAAATADCVPGTVPDAVQQQIDALKPLGALRDSTFIGVQMNNANGKSSAVVGGTATFGTTPKSVQFTLIPNPGGKPLVETWSIR